MANDVEFEDFRIEVKGRIKELAISFLHEVTNELRSQASRKSRRKTSQTAGSYQNRVEDGELTGYVGSDYWNAIYEEFGTGEFAIEGKGRKGYWVFVDTGGAPQPPKGGKTLTLAQAKRAVAILRKKGLNAYYTKGKTANRPLYKAFTENKTKIIQRAESIFRGLGE